MDSVALRCTYCIETVMQLTYNMLAIRRGSHTSRTCTY